MNIGWTYIIQNKIETKTRKDKDKIRAKHKKTRNCNKLKTWQDRTWETRNKREYNKRQSMIYKQKTWNQINQINRIN